ncbi:MAG: type III glutamate--ammonia ligase, partial [Gaiellaceae bacterium]
PYLAAAAVLASGLDGIERKLDAGEPNAENLYAFPYAELRARGLETLPSSLLHATDELVQDDVLRDALGHAREEDYVDYFIRVKRDEWNRYHERVTPWEIREYLTRF